MGDSLLVTSFRVWSGLAALAFPIPVRSPPPLRVHRPLEALCRPLGLVLATLRGFHRPQELHLDGHLLHWHVVFE